MRGSQEASVDCRPKSANVLKQCCAGHVQDALAMLSLQRQDALINQPHMAGIIPDGVEQAPRSSVESG